MLLARYDEVSRLLKGLDVGPLTTKDYGPAVFSPPFDCLCASSNLVDSLKRMFETQSLFHILTFPSLPRSLRLCSWPMPTFSKAYTQVTELSLSDRLETTFAASAFQPNKSYHGECCVGGREDGDRRLSTQNGLREMPPSAHGMKGLHRHVVT